MDENVRRNKMDNELPLARQQERPVLLAICSDGEAIYNNSVRAEGKEENTTSAGETAETPASAKKASKAGAKAKASATRANRAERHRRSDKDRSSDGGVEGGDSISRRRTQELVKPIRSAEALGIEWFGNVCEDSPSGAHYFIATDDVDRGKLFRCVYCHRHRWLPTSWGEIDKYNILIKKDITAAYRKMLDQHPTAKVLVAKLQDLRRVRKTVKDDKEFMKIVVAVMNDKEYGR